VLFVVLLSAAYLAYVVGRRHQRFVQSHADVHDAYGKVRMAWRIRLVMARAALVGWLALTVVAVFVLVIATT
jgi:hypothetical protein